jgi:hypothetical protein
LDCDFALTSSGFGTCCVFVLQGLVHPWDAHSHEDGSDDFKFVKEDIGEVPTLETEEGHDEGDEEH